MKETCKLCRSEDAMLLIRKGLFKKDDIKWCETCGTLFDGAEICIPLSGAGYAAQALVGELWGELLGKMSLEEEKSGPT
jgi:hypothetical protein